MLLTSLIACGPGCTIGPLGASLVRTTTTPTAIVYDVYSPGIVIRPSAFERGLSLGFRRATYLTPNPSPGDPRGCSTKWGIGHVTFPSDRVLLRGQQVFGIELEASTNLGRFAVGYVDTVLTVGPADGRSVLVQLQWDRKAPCHSAAHMEELDDETRETR